MQWTVYVDMDAFYVSCEIRDRPDLAGQPVIVGPDPKLGPSRGVVLSASYEARAFGVRSAVPAGRAAALCPDAIWVPADHAKYSRISTEVLEYLARFGERVVPLSIDEAAVEVDRPDAPSAGARAREIQQGLRADLRLPASLGVSPHRVIAKIASDRAKPGGVVVVPPEESASFLAPLPVSVIPGVGPKTTQRLKEAGIERIADLTRVRRSELRRVVGSFSEELRALADGEPRPEIDRDGPRSRSAAETFSEDVGDLGRLQTQARSLAGSLARSVEEEGLRFQSVSVSVRWSDFGQSQRSRSLLTPGRSGEQLEPMAERLLGELWERERAARARRVRTLSVGVGRLSTVPRGQRALEAFASSPGHTVKRDAPPDEPDRR